MFRSCGVEPGLVPAAAGPRATADAAATWLLVLLMVVPWLWNATPGPSPNVLPLFVSWACAGAAVLVVACARNPVDLGHLLPLVWITAALANASIGLLQWFGMAPDVAAFSPARLGEAYGNLRQRNQFASLTSLGFAALVFCGGRLPRAAVLCAAVILAAGNAVSASRTGLLQWALVAALAAAWPGDRLRRLVVCGAGLAAYTLAAWALPSVLEMVHGVRAMNALDRALSELGCSSRRVLWSNVLHLIQQRPWTGWGLGELDYAHYSVLYPGERFCDILDNAHNLPLHIAVEMGVPAAVGFTAALLFLCLRARPWREANPERQLAWCALALIGVHSLLEYPLWYGPFQLAVLLALALLLPVWRPGRWRPAAVGSVLVLFTAIGLGWDEYLRVMQAYLPPEARRPAARVDPVAAAGHPWLFKAQLQFARVSVMPLTPSNAAEVYALAVEALHYSPEPLVIEKAISAAMALGREDEAGWHLARYRAAFPEQYASWIGIAGAPRRSP